MTQKKGGILKGILGCGCLLVVSGLLAFGLLGWGAYEASRKVKELAESKLDASDIAKIREEFKIPDVAKEQVSKAVERPLEAADVDRFLALNDWYYEQPANDRAAKLMELDFSNPMGVMEVLSDADAQKEVQELLKAFPAEVEKQGGWSTAVDSAVRTVAIAALADAVGTASGKPAASKEVAAVLLENSSKLQDPNALQALGVTDAGAMKPLMAVLQKTPRASFENWLNLPEPTRERVMQTWRRQAKAALAAQFNPILKTCNALSLCP
ncbi:MAG: hypothetical protein R3E66_16210 [bacterium]